MNWRAPWRYLRDWPVGVKLPATMALVVALTALAISYLLGVSGKAYIYDAAVGQLSRQLRGLVEGLPGPTGPVEDWEPSLEQAAARLQTMSGLGERLYFFVLDPQGRLVFSRPKSIPPTAGERQRMARRAAGSSTRCARATPSAWSSPTTPPGWSWACGWTRRSWRGRCWPP